jgi:hypothetical protein
MTFILARQIGLGAFGEQSHVVGFDIERAAQSQESKMLSKRNVSIAILCGFLGAACVVGPHSLLAQAPAGPLPQAQPSTVQPPPKTRDPKLEQRKTLSGFWELNLDESDDPQKIKQDAKRVHNGGPHGGGRRSGGGFPIDLPGGNGGSSGGRGGANRSGQNGDQMRDLIGPANSISITLKEAEVDLTDDHGRKLVFYTDGRKLQNSKDETYREIAAHWDGNRLVSDEKSPQGSKMSRSFELAADCTQFYEILHIESSRSNAPLLLRYVYDAAAQDKP